MGQACNVCNSTYEEYVIKKLERNTVYKKRNRADSDSVLYDEKKTENAGEVTGIPDQPFVSADNTYYQLSSSKGTDQFRQHDGNFAAIVQKLVLSAIGVNNIKPKSQPTKPASNTFNLFSSSSATGNSSGKDEKEDSPNPDANDAGTNSQDTEIISNLLKILWPAESANIFDEMIKYVEEYNDVSLLKKELKKIDKDLKELQFGLISYNQSAVNERSSKLDGLLDQCDALYAKLSGNHNNRAQYIILLIIIANIHLSLLLDQFRNCKLYYADDSDMDQWLEELYIICQIYCNDITTIFHSNWKDWRLKQFKVKKLADDGVSEGKGSIIDKISGKNCLEFDYKAAKLLYFCTDEEKINLKNNYENLLKYCCFNNNSLLFHKNIISTVFWLPYYLPEFGESMVRKVKAQAEDYSYSYNNYSTIGGVRLGHVQCGVNKAWYQQCGPYLALTAADLASVPKYEEFVNQVTVTVDNAAIAKDLIYNNNFIRQIDIENNDKHLTCLRFRYQVHKQKFKGIEIGKKKIHGSKSTSFKIKGPTGVPTSPTGYESFGVLGDEDSEKAKPIGFAVGYIGDSVTVNCMKFYFEDGSNTGWVGSNDIFKNESILRVYDTADMSISIANSIGRGSVSIGGGMDGNDGNNDGIGPTYHVIGNNCIAAPANESDDNVAPQQNMGHVNGIACAGFCLAPVFETSWDGTQPKK